MKWLKNWLTKPRRRYRAWQADRFRKRIAGVFPFDVVGRVRFCPSMQWDDTPYALFKKSINYQLNDTALETLSHMHPRPFNSIVEILQAQPSLWPFAERVLTRPENGVAIAAILRSVPRVALIGHPWSYPILSNEVQKLLEDYLNRRLLHSNDPRFISSRIKSLIAIVYDMMQRHFTDQEVRLILSSYGIKRVSRVLLWWNRWWAFGRVEHYLKHELFKVTSHQYQEYPYIAPWPHLQIGKARLVSMNSLDDFYYLSTRLIRVRNCLPEMFIQALMNQKRTYLVEIDGRAVGAMSVTTKQYKIAGADHHLVCPIFWTLGNVEAQVSEDDRMRKQFFGDYMAMDTIYEELGEQLAGYSTTDELVPTTGLLIHSIMTRTPTVQEQQTVKAMMYRLLELPISEDLGNYIYKVGFR